MKFEKAIELITDELLKAQEKHPNWPTDKIHCAAILGEEAGELLQSSIDYEYAGNSFSKRTHHENMIIEAAQTGAMAIRFLMNMEN